MHELLGALVHEVGNLLAAVRLQAHGIEHDRSPRELAASVVSIDSACARAGALVSLVQPMECGSVERRRIPGAQLVEALREELLDQGTRGAELRLEIAPDLPEVLVAPAIFHSAFLVYTTSSLEAVGSQGRLRLVVQSEAGRMAVQVIDDASQSLAQTEGSLGGRRLALALLREVALLHDADLEVDPSPGRNAVRWRF